VLAITADGMCVAVGTQRGVVVLAHMDRGEVTRLREPGGDWISELAFSEDETRLVPAAQGGRLEVWDLDSSARVVQFCATTPGLRAEL
jgi:hypothetical protein